VAGHDDTHAKETDSACMCADTMVCGVAHVRPMNHMQTKSHAMAIHVDIHVQMRKLHGMQGVVVCSCGIYVRPGICTNAVHVNSCALPLFPGGGCMLVVAMMTSIQKRECACMREGEASLTSLNKNPTYVEYSALCAEHISFGHG
jgi:hypothetical protein